MAQHLDILAVVKPEGTDDYFTYNYWGFLSENHWKDDALLIGGGLLFNADWSPYTTSAIYVRTSNFPSIAENSNHWVLIGGYDEEEIEEGRLNGEWSF